MDELGPTTGTHGYERLRTIGSPFGFGTLVLSICRKERSYLLTVLTHVCRLWCCSSSYSCTSI